MWEHALGGEAGAKIRARPRWVYKRFSRIIGFRRSFSNTCTRTYIIAEGNEQRER